MGTVVVIGEAMIELSTSGHHRLKWTFAGDTLNCAAAIAAVTSDGAVRYYTGLGDDTRSGELVDFCAALGVDVAGSPIVAGGTLGLYWISTERGERHFQYWRNESAARQVLRSETHLPELASGDAIVLSGITLAVAGPSASALLDKIEQVKRAGTLVAYDTNHRHALWPDLRSARLAADRAVSLADIVHASADDVDQLWSLGGADFISKLGKLGVGETIVTDGATSIAASVGGTNYEREPRTVEVVDTTGAGDAFFGTYLGHRLAGHGADEALSLAIETAAIVVQTPGALNYLAPA